MCDRPHETLHGAVVVARRPDGVAVVERLPDGWRFTGSCAKWDGRLVRWACNGMSRFARPKVYEHALVIDWQRGANGSTGKERRDAASPQAGGHEAGVGGHVPAHKN